MTQYKHYAGLSEDRLYRILYRRITRNLDGGGMFGTDWNTLNVLYPALARIMRDLCERRIVTLPLS
jgi:hypothetical protein